MLSLRGSVRNRTTAATGDRGVSSTRVRSRTTTAPVFEGRQVKRPHRKGRRRSTPAGGASPTTGNDFQDKPRRQRTPARSTSASLTTLFRYLTGTRTGAYSASRRYSTTPEGLCPATGVGLENFCTSFSTFSTMLQAHGRQA